MSEIEWNAPSKLFRRHADGQVGSDVVVLIGPLHWLVDWAASGTDGAVGNLYIKTVDGTLYEADDIRRLLVARDRPQRG